MICLTTESGVTCTRWVMLAGMLASAVAAFLLISRLREVSEMPDIPDAGDDINGM